MDIQRSNLGALARDLKPLLLEFYDTLKRYQDLEYCEAIDKASKEIDLDRRLDEIVKKHIPNAKREDDYLADYDLSLALYSINNKSIEIIMDEFNYICEMYKLREVLPETPRFTILLYENGSLVESIPII